MLKDRVTKILLAVTAIGLWGLLLRPVVNVPTVEAQAKPTPTPTRPARTGAVTTSKGEPIVVVYEGKPLVIIHNGKISVWEVWDEGDGKFRLIHGDTKPLP